MAGTGTPGQVLAAELRRYFSVGPRSRRYRNGSDLHSGMVEALRFTAWYPGYFTGRTETALRPGYGAALAYDKHAGGYRIDGTLHALISAMSPWAFAGLLGAMVDAGVTCTGDGERFFTAMARESRQP